MRESKVQGRTVCAREISLCRRTPRADIESAPTDVGKNEVVGADACIGPRGVEDAAPYKQRYKGAIPLQHKKYPCPGWCEPSRAGAFSVLFV